MRDKLFDNERIFTAVGDICAGNQLLNPEVFREDIGPHPEVIQES